MILNSKGQVTIPAELRARHNLHEGDEVQVVEVEGALLIIPAEDALTRGQRMARRLRATATSKDIEGMSTDEIMELLRGD